MEPQETYDKFTLPDHLLQKFDNTSQWQWDSSQDPWNTPQVYIPYDDITGFVIELAHILHENNLGPNSVVLTNGYSAEFQNYTQF